MTWLLYLDGGCGETGLVSEVVGGSNCGNVGPRWLWAFGPSTFMEPTLPRWEIEGMVIGGGLVLMEGVEGSGVGTGV
jgi:hypothetical protein